jgi:hypothetical protein
MPLDSDGSTKTTPVSQRATAARVTTAAATTLTTTSTTPTTVPGRRRNTVARGRSVRALAASP